MSRVDTVVIGAGQAGLAVSHLLAASGHDHVVLDRGRIAESWRSERWDSLRLLTPRWMTRLPGWHYAGPDQDGYMPKAELVQHLERYAQHSPVELGEEVHRVTASGDGYVVDTDGRTWQARHVVVATGPTGRPHRPPTIELLDPDLQVLTTAQYRSPYALAAGGVLVVGASASGVQIADELVRSGRRVVLAVGRHSRMPRTYRGMDLFWWLEQTGRLARTIDEVADADAARGEPSLQIAGREPSDPRGADVDLLALQTAGVELVGRLERVDGHHAEFHNDLATSTRDADARMYRFLDDVDRYVADTHLTGEMFPADRPRPVPVRPTATRIDLRSAGITTVILATGFRPHHPWLQVPVLAANGAIVQRRGVTPAAGLYVVGQRFQHRRDSSMIDGARHDARDVVSHLQRRQRVALDAEAAR